MKKKQTILTVTLWAVLTLWVWLVPAKDISQTERRPLAQMPAFSV